MNRVVIFHVLSRKNSVFAVSVDPVTLPSENQVKNRNSSTLVPIKWLLLLVVFYKQNRFYSVKHSINRTG